jgi:hypothetical protein
VSWARLDDTFASHPKVRRLLGRYGIDGLVALGWWTLLLSATRDGMIERDVALGMMPTADPDRMAAMLLEVGLLDRVAEGRWAFHDWTEYQSEAQQAKAGKARAAGAERGPGGRFLSQRAGDPLAPAPASALDEQGPKRSPEPETTQRAGPAPSSPRTRPVPVPYVSPTPRARASGGWRSAYERALRPHTPSPTEARAFDEMAGRRGDEWVATAIGEEFRRISRSGGRWGLKVLARVRDRDAGEAAGLAG